MTVKTFSIFTGIVMVVAVAVLTFTKNLSKSFSAVGRKPLLLGLATSILDALIAFGITFLESEDSFLLFWLLSFVFLVFGTVQVIATNRFFVKQEEENGSNVMAAEILFNTGVLLLTAALFIALQFFLGTKTFLFYPLLLSLLFFPVPLLFYYTYRAALDIPAPVYILWRYPKVPIDLPDDNQHERLLVIGFELDKKLSDKRKAFFRAKTPEGILLGDLFYHFINDYNEVQSETPIEVMDDKGEPIDWWFRLKRKWYQPSKVLDPSITVRENRIKENSVIICDHIIH